VREGFEPSVEL